MPHVENKLLSLEAASKYLNSNIKVTTSNYASFYIKNGEKYEAANKFYEASWLEAGNHYYQKTNFVNRWEDGYVEN